MIYIVFEGEYSDRHVIGVFDDRKLAEEFGGVTHAIEEYTLNDSGGQQVQTFWKVKIDLDTGDIRPSYPEDSKLAPIGCGARARHYDSRPHGANNLYVESPRSLEHAVKVATEKRQAYIRARASGAETSDILNALNEEVL